MPRRCDRCAQAQDVGTEAQRESGKALYLEVLRAVPRRQRRRRRLRHAAPVPQAAQLHDRQVQGADDAQRCAPDASGPRQHHQARHALHVDAGLAQPHRPGSVGRSRTTSRPSPPTSRTPRMPHRPSTLPSAPNATSESIELGKKLYEETGCARCHGTLGRGDGPSAPTLKDDWDHPIRAADLTQSWTFRGGSSREDIFRTMSTGFNGTPMPSFLDALTPEQRWAITDYIVSLSGSNGPWLHQPRRRQARRRADRSGQGGRELRRRARGPLSDRRADHGAGTRVPSARDERHRSGDLRRGRRSPCSCDGTT